MYGSICRSKRLAVDDEDAGHAGSPHEAEEIRRPTMRQLIRWQELEVERYVRVLRMARERLAELRRLGVRRRGER